jgi:hypothetical protein
MWTIPAAVTFRCVLFSSCPCLSLFPLYLVKLFVLFGVVVSNVLVGVLFYSQIRGPRCGWGALDLVASRQFYSLLSTLPSYYPTSLHAMASNRKPFKPYEFVRLQRYHDERTLCGAAPEPESAIPVVASEPLPTRAISTHIDYKPSTSYKSIIAPYYSKETLYGTVSKPEPPTPAISTHIDYKRFTPYVLGAAPAFILRLSNELLDNVAGYLASDLDLYNLALSCKPFRIPAQRALWHTVHMDKFGKPVSLKYRYRFHEMPFKPTYCFLCLLINHPEVAAMINVVYIVMDIDDVASLQGYNRWLGRVLGPTSSFWSRDGNMNLAHCVLDPECKAVSCRGLIHSEVKDFMGAALYLLPSIQHIYISMPTGTTTLELP